MKISLTNTVTVTLGTLLLAIGVASCNVDEQLNPVPKTAISDLVVFDTPTRIRLQINNLYAYAKSGSFLGGRYQVYGDVRADDFINRTSNSVTAAQVWNHTLTETSSNDVISLWGIAYQTINQANVFLVGLEANTAKYVAPVFPADFATVTVPQYQAEARFVRALSYYSLLQLYARPYIDGAGSRPGLPLRLQAETGAGGNDLARSTVAEVYAQILSDLTFAEQNLPLTYGTATADLATNSTRAHRNTAIALKTRVYLTMGQYSNVVTEANKIVPTAAPFTASSGVPHSLNASIAAVFSTENAESILSFPFTAQNTPGTQNQLGFYYLPPQNPGGPTGGGEYYLNPTGILANTTALSATDDRRVGFFLTSGGNTYLAKYRGGTPYIDKAPVMRYAEVLLSLSEALFRNNGPADARALALLNAVRTRSKGAAYTSFASTDAAVGAVLLERRIEFLGEGIRNIDIMRLNATIPAKSSVPAIPPSSPNYVWPIPQSETVTNGLITPN
ncbi:RagB/SusD family nutrient uptake outer membrane protein [Hymenobacter aerilatus]|uniref:RagB/SusD family nutrient uptake outer membrane protein n=1 Tax=Hymenobacter aerilatus TaxID=2932251 RepID=A0A8T9SQ22_9BACT|nr:RagB/SusD family nutrient uptake outer membrane protein [Hymenobacter aerilatus]UOR04248.1 RagB/SusD family nutrient uptake outer membrane protein [Hymenobacter aerilatus]